jgi:hypothetical protein
MNEPGILRLRPAHGVSGPHDGCHVTARQRLLTHKHSLPPPEPAIVTVIGSTTGGLGAARTPPRQTGPPPSGRWPVTQPGLR